MPKNSRIAFLAALCALGFPPAFGQSPAPVPGATSLEYRSAFESYRPFGRQNMLLKEVEVLVRKPMGPMRHE